MIRRTIFLILTCGLFVSIHAQDYKVDMEKAVRIWNENSYEIEMTHLFYPSLQSVTPLETETVWICKSGENYHAKYYGLEVISNGLYNVAINDEQHIIAVVRREAPKTETSESKEIKELFEEMANKITSSLGIDGTSSMQDAFTAYYLGEGKGVKTYRFDYTYGQYAHSMVNLSSKTGLIEKITVQLRDKVEIEPGKYSQAKVEIVFNKQVSGEKYPDNIFSTDTIFSVDKSGRVILKGKYTQYHLINQITK